MPNDSEQDALNLFAQRMRDLSAQLNAARQVLEPEPESRFPVLGPLFAWLRRLACRLATRWYVAPQMEQQARFAQELTAAFDELADGLVRHEGHLDDLGQSRETLTNRIESLEKLTGRIESLEKRTAAIESPEGLTGRVESLGKQIRLLAVPPAAPVDHLSFLKSLPEEVLQSWEHADLPPRDEDRPVQPRAFDEAGVLHFPLCWTAQRMGWHYLFNMAVAGLSLNCRPGDRVLDFAGGSGWVSEFLNRMGMHTVLLDYSEIQLHYSKTRFAADRRVGSHARIALVAGDGMRLPFADGSFDGIVCMNSLHHMPSYEAALREMARILKPGGRAVFGEPGEKHAQSPAAQASWRDYGDLEKNVPLPLIYAYARQVGFDGMVRYPYIYPEGMELPYPGGGEDPAAVLRAMALNLPEWMACLSLFALEKAGQRELDSDLPPLAEDRHCLRAEITLLDYTERVALGTAWVERVRVRNIGDVVWLAAERPLGGYVRLGVKLCDAAGQTLDMDLERASLPHDLSPGEEVELAMTIRAPEQPGLYQLKYDMVDEGRVWFEAAGSAAVTHTLQVSVQRHG